MSYRELFHKLRNDVKALRVRGVAGLNRVQDEIFLLENEKVRTDGKLQVQNGVAIIREGTYVIVEIQNDGETLFDVYMAGPESYQSVVQAMKEYQPAAA
jgi:hypothetical protein